MLQQKQRASATGPGQSSLLDQAISEEMQDNEEDELHDASSNALQQSSLIGALTGQPNS